MVVFNKHRHGVWKNTLCNPIIRPCWLRHSMAGCWLDGAGVCKCQPQCRSNDCEADFSADKMAINVVFHVCCPRDSKLDPPL